MVSKYDCTGCRYNTTPNPYGVYCDYYKKMNWNIEKCIVTDKAKDK